MLIKITYILAKTHTFGVRINIVECTTNPIYNIH